MKPKILETSSKLCNLEKELNASKQVACDKESELRNNREKFAKYDHLVFFKV